MQDPAHIFVLFVVLGLMLLAIEVFVPGGVIGIFGVISLLAAAATAFVAFGPQGGFLVSVVLIVGSGILLALWLKFFPGTRLGHKLTLQTDGRSYKSAVDLSEKYMGREGVAQSSLRPAGIAVIDNQRIDVVAESGYIESGCRVRVIQVEGNRIVVRAMTTS